ncbi:MAG: hypothetical protein GXO26_04285, partial [Crenarchaeota archaeon]|nr:hypothetical protein [Thermoproteota archaeon]
MLDKLLSLLGLGGGRRPAPPPVVRANLLDTLLMLELQDPKFSEIFPKLLQFDPKVRDVFLYLAYLMCNILRRLGLGDEYGIYQYIVDRLLTPMGDLRRYEQFRRAVTRCEHFVNYPYYDIYVAFNTPLFSVAVAPLFREADRAVPILRVMNASKNMYIPFVFIMTARNITITPEVFNVQRY